MTERPFIKIKNILLSSKYAVFFGGAGVSTDSGIPDFRGSNGLYRCAEESNEYYLSRECLMHEPDKFYAFFRRNMLFPSAAPNATHKALAQLEQRGIIKAVITQNIDALHQAAGSKRVIELHGTANRYYCTRCRKVYSKAILSESDNVPTCTHCGAVVRPDVTLYGEALDGFNFADARNEIAKADVLIAGGTSLTVQPAASLLDAFRGKHLIIINYSPTPYDSAAEFIVRDSLSAAFSFFAEES